MDFESSSKGCMFNSSDKLRQRKEFPLNQVHFYSHEKFFSKEWIFKKDFYLVYFMCVSVFPTCMLVHHVCSCCLWKSEEGIRSPGTVVIQGSEPPCGC